MTARYLFVGIALLCFGGAMFGVPVRINLTAAGLFFWLASSAL